MGRDDVFQDQLYSYASKNLHRSVPSSYGKGIILEDECAHKNLFKRYFNYFEKSEYQKKNPKKICKEYNNLISSFFIPIIQLFKYYISINLLASLPLNLLCSIESFFLADSEVF